MIFSTPCGWLSSDFWVSDLFYDIRLNPAVAIFQIFASQMIGYGIAGLRMLRFFSDISDRANCCRRKCETCWCTQPSEFAPLSSVCRNVTKIAQRFLPALHLRCQLASESAFQGHAQSQEEVSSCSMHTGSRLTYSPGGISG